MRLTITPPQQIALALVLTNANINTLLNPHAISCITIDSTTTFNEKITTTLTQSLYLSIDFVAAAAASVAAGLSTDLINAVTSGGLRYISVSRKAYNSFSSPFIASPTGWISKVTDVPTAFIEFLTS